MPLCMQDPSDQAGGEAVATPQGSFYFGSPISDEGNLGFAFQLARNQILLGVSSLFTIASLQQTGEPGGDVILDVGVTSVLLALFGSLPLLFAGFKLSRSEDPLFTDINCSTNLLVLRLFGRRKKIASATLASSLLGLLTGFCEELSFRGIAFPILAVRVGGSESAGLAGLLASSLLFGLAHASLSAGPRSNLTTILLQTCSGLWFGTLYLLAGRNLLVPALAHGLYDAFTLVEAHVTAVTQIDYAEANAPRAAAGEMSPEEEAERRVREVFFLADTDKNQQLSVPEVRSALFQLDTGIKESRLGELFAGADEDGNGALSEQEFKAFVAALRQEPPTPPKPPPSGFLGLR